MPFPWYAGQVLTADRFNARNSYMITQDTDQVFTSTTTLTNTQIVVPVEAGAVYVYWLFVSYSATTASDMKWAWAAPVGTLLSSYTSAFIAGAASGLNTGAAIIMRRPANTTERLAGGTDTASPPTNFHSAYDRGTITVGGTAGNVILQAAQNTSSVDQTVIRGGNQTRLVYSRIL